METAVAFFIWRRPDLTKLVFDRIAEVRPRTLIIIADGPKPGDLEGEERCAATRKLVERVDWPCEVHRDYAASNLGLRNRLESGLDFIFSIVSKAIMLEDDTLPDQTFFRFMHDLLLLYENDLRVGGIGGYKPPGISTGANSYGFSRYPMVWGWATWRRVWLGHNRRMSSWPQAKRDNMMLSILGSEAAAGFWTKWLDKHHSGRANSYAVPFIYSGFFQDLRFAVPSVSLTSNTGFRADATHTRDLDSLNANAPTAAMTWPLTHPTSLESRPIDHQIERMIFSRDPNAYLA